LARLRPCSPEIAPPNPIAGIASHRQIRQGPCDRVAVPALLTAVRALGVADTGLQKIVVSFSSTAASVIVTPNSIVRMIVSATTDGGQAVASGKGHLGGLVGE
jgi:hypothetical protein